MNLLKNSIEPIRIRLQSIYKDATAQEVDDLFHSLSDVLDGFAADQTPTDQTKKRFDSLWSEQDVVLITYADQVSQKDRPTLQTLNEFLIREGVAENLNTVHLLPFYPYSSDDGFSVIDYYDLAPGVGSWNDIANLNESVDLMFDLVLNHCSQHSEWFQQYLRGDSKYKNFFHSFSENEATSPSLTQQLSLVTRPRSLPLLTEFETVDGTRWVWTTFSDDQVDLDFSRPEVLVEFVRILLFYVRSGARIIRMDAVAFLWKELGTSCIHLAETHEVIKLFRDILNLVAPEVILLTETNVPHDENVSYFGSGDEAHMVYQFSLPPLIVDTFIHEDPAPLRHWLMDLDAPPAGTTFFNFGASHDGIGVRPLEGLLEQDRFESLIQEIRNRGGHVSTRRQPDGSDTPYELNVSYYDAIVGAGSERVEWLSSEDKVRKFLSSQSIILAMPGIPGIYFHSLVGTPNDAEGANSSGIPRRINRRKYDLEELQELIRNDEVQRGIFQYYLDLIKIRTHSSAFHPEGSSRVWEADDCGMVGSENLFVMERTSPDGLETVWTIVNPTRLPVQLKLSDTYSYFDMVTEVDGQSTSTMMPFDFRWYGVQKK